MLTELTFHGLDIVRVEPDGNLIDFVADELPAGAALLFGQADQQIPTTAVRGLEYQDGEGEPNSGGVVRADFSRASS
jgi:hypothetical protein